MVSFTPTVTADVSGLVWVNGANTSAEKRERLRIFLGPAVIEAVNTLNDGISVGTAVSMLVDAFLPDSLKSVLALFEEHSVLSSQDVVERLNLHVSAASNRLTQLERLGKIGCVSREGRTRKFALVVYAGAPRQPGQTFIHPEGPIS